jgi:hypothetical protein
MTDRDRCRLHTTGRLAQQVGACSESYDKLHDHLGGESYGLDTPVGLDLVCEVLGLADALWALQCVLPEQEAERDRIARLFVCECVERVLPIFERERPDDRRPRETLAVVRRFAVGEATKEELAAAYDTALATAVDTARGAAGTAAEDAAWAIVGAAAAWVAADDAAWAALRATVSAARATARATAGAAAGAAIWAAVRVAARYTERAQREIFLRLLSTDKESVPVTT